ncbi:hypothetical protein F4604DRAFT_1681369 [Suillus subluteus]|nr:hypothetical protein F4604DRAFT_1681369 [Suillus subluteus]
MGGVQSLRGQGTKLDVRLSDGYKLTLVRCVSEVKKYGDTCQVLTSDYKAASLPPAKLTIVLVTASQEMLVGSRVSSTHFLVFCGGGSLGNGGDEVRRLRWTWIQGLLASFASTPIDITKGPLRVNYKARKVRLYDLVVGKHELRLFTDRASDAKDLAGILKIDVSSADAWFEQDEPVYVHLKDP